MNLINDPWIPILREDGTKERIAPWQIAEMTNPVIDIDAPRHDFKGALYQFLIGLLQTAFAPPDADDWEELWDLGLEPQILKSRLDLFEEAFELFSETGPAFMQDLLLDEAKEEPIEYLLIEAPQENARNLNTDHFVKRGQVSAVCDACTAALLFTFNTVGPAVGTGYRVGVRGGGPLTTLVLPDSARELLWKRLWLNVITEDVLGRSAKAPRGDVFPWLEKTKLSGKPKQVCGIEKKCEGCERCGIRPDEKSRLYHYWAMPQRIRLIASRGAGRCDICDHEADVLFSHYKITNYGNNYIGEWIHPLTPYKFDLKKKKLPLSYKGQYGGVGYKDWLAVNFIDKGINARASLNVSHFIENYAKGKLGSIKPRIWCFGYDLKSRKAKCMYQSQLPMFNLDAKNKDELLSRISDMISCASDVAKILSQHVKEAIFKPSTDDKGRKSWKNIPSESFGKKVEQEFWQLTEAPFYQMLHQLIQLNAEEQFPKEVYRQWLQALCKSMFQLFDKYTLDSPPEDLDMKRIVLARTNLTKKYFGNKHIKQMKIRSQQLTDNKKKELS